MKTVVRIYVQVNGKEECIKEPKAIIKALTSPKAEIDLDYTMENGHVKIGTSRDLMGQEVLVNGLPVRIPEH
jgi:hypothetical protein